MPRPASEAHSGVSFCLPDLGEGLTSAEIVQWHVNQGDSVTQGQPLVAVETDKAIVEIPAPYSGRIVELRAGVGATVAVGAPLVIYDPAPRADNTGIVGRLPDGNTHGEERAAPRQTRVRASPKARRRARELNLDLSELEPASGSGVLQVSDVEQAADPDRLSGVRKAMAVRMADAHKRVARSTVTGESDISTWASRSRPLTRLIQAVVAACHAEPILNAHFNDETNTLSQNETVNLGIAIDTPAGLFTPCIKDVARLSETQLMAQIKKLREQVKDRKVTPDALTGQTITLSNFGAFGGRHAEMIVVPPQVAIVGAGAIFERVTLIDDIPAPVRTLPLSITFDHRVVTGAQACRFLNVLSDSLSQPL